MKAYPSSRGDLYLGRYQDGLDRLIRTLDPSGILWVADSNTAQFCLPVLGDLPGEKTVMVIPDGEIHKDLESCQQIWSGLIDMKADRNTLVINMGGGMICDLGGFAAACFQRGIRFAHLPTSLLAMADAAIGGKTGVDFRGFKNYIGRIEVPAFIWIDPVYLDTLPEPEMRNGLTEIIKHAIIGSESLWTMLGSMDSLQQVDWYAILEENVKVKQRIVEEDPFEKGRRKILNFGHTIGHALESYFLETDTPLRHGEAVALGMMAESRMALDLGILPEEDFNRIIAIIHRMLRPVEVPLPSVAALAPWLAGDKKNETGKNRYSLPEKIGSCRWNVTAHADVVSGAMQWMTAHGLQPGIRLNT